MPHSIYSKLKVCLCSAFITQFVLLPSVHAGPSGGNIVGGSGSINQSALITNINQNSTRLAIDWQSFNINQNETVNFNQPGSSSIALNRILDQNASQIHGAINANGQVVLVNPNGVFFGANATVNVGGLFASALDIDSQDFMNGKLDFKALENTSGLIVNEGTLQVIDGGTLALLGQQVKNEGLLIANFGTVALAAGSDISVQFEDQTHTSITVNANTLAGVLGIDEPAIFNSGLIQAHGGRVVLNARQAQAIKESVANFDSSTAFSFDQGQVIEKDGVVYLAGPDGDIADLGVIDVSSEAGNGGEVAYTGNNINHSGLINADNQNGNGGKVVIDATDTVILKENSTITAQSHQQGAGGTVHVLGKNVGLVDQANINASGTNGGGQVLIGGDYQGKNPDIKNAEAAYLGVDTGISANATENGNGGEVIVWSDKASRVYGSLHAKGGEQSGDGGFIETSSHDYVDLAPKVDVHAENGSHGQWLIDPSSIFISGGGTSGDITGGVGGPVFSTTTAAEVSNLNVHQLEDALGNGAAVTVITAANPLATDPTAGGDITLSSELDLDDVTDSGDNLTSGTYSLTLQAHRNINISASITESGSGGGSDSVDHDDGLNLTLITTGGNITLDSGVSIELEGGNFSATGRAFLGTGSTITTINPTTSNAGNVAITAIAGNVTLGNIFTDASNGDLTINASGSIVDGASSTLDISGVTRLTAGSTNNITLDNASVNDFKDDVIVSAGGNVVIRDKNDLSIGNVTNVVTLNARATDLLSQAAGSSINATNAILRSDNGVLDLGDVSVTNLTVTASDAITVKAGAVVNVGNISSFTSIGDSIFLDGANNFGNIIRLNSNTFSTIESSGAVNLGTSNVTDDLNITAVGSVTDETGENIIVGGATNLSVSENSAIELDSTGNVFTGNINIIANTLSSLAVTDNSDFTLQNGVDVTGNINLRADSLTLNSLTLGAASELKLTSTAANGDINQNFEINHTGTTVLSSDGTITLTESNNFANIQIDNSADGFTTTTATIDNSNNTGITTLNGVNGTADLSVIATGGTAGITETDVLDVSGNATFNTGSNILKLDNSIHRLNNVNITSAGTVLIQEADNINISGSMSSLDVQASLSAAGSTISNVFNTQLTVTGESRFDVRTGGNIDLANFANATRNDLAGDIFINEGGQRVNDVSIRNQSGIQLASAIRVDGGLDMDTVGDITQTAGSTIRLIGGGVDATNLTAANVFLEETNDFITLNVNNSAVTRIYDNNQVVFNSSANGSVQLTAWGAVELNGDMNSLQVDALASSVVSGAGSTLNVTTDTIINAGLTSVDFATNAVNLNNLTVNNGGAVSVLEADGINLSGDMQGLNVTLQSGNIGSGASNLVVTGVTTLDATISGNIDLNNDNNNFNDINITNVQDLTLHDVDDLTLKNISARDLNVTTNGTLDQEANTALISTGISALDSNSGDIILLENNEFTNLSLNGRSATMFNNKELQLSGALSDSVDVSVANGNLILNNISAGSSANFLSTDSILDGNGTGLNISANTIFLTAASGIGLVGPPDDSSGYIDIRASNVSALNTTDGDINLKNSSGLITLDSIVNTASATDEGNFNFETTNDVNINTITLVKNLDEAFFPAGNGRVNMQTAEGSFFAVGDVNVPDITATNLRLIGVKGTLGTLQRSVLLDISGKVELLMRASLAPKYVDPAPADADIIDQSLLRFTSADTLSAANGVQVTEVETLLDIDPAIFTELQHFVVDADPVLLPRDQLYDVEEEDEEEDDEYFKRISGDSASLIN